ncbi:Signal peptidase complex catalytic subunit SEC11 [Colletotrichum siamense]|uniref:Signal peptidase complex catalytic subunit SEC11 n=1 Tax=Colletotrichum siamense TaxID=690259 RepID=A0A9P5BRC6_COLSI|nr:Signal peptidase complex catalytic subunit SEC11 [Colletotrichum siamense]KAF4844742.1 Signal peptidase complex catalytic subunit SEC11 [Colletotrichum siamense]
MPSRRVPSVLRLLERSFMAWKALSLATNCAYPAMVVLSESMEPAFSRGDIILLANWQDVEVGDIPVIWFQEQPLPMVHRAVEVLLAPPLLFAASATLTTVALHFPTHTHRLFTFPAWLLATWSLLSVDEDNASSLIGLGSYTAITSFIFMLILPNILFGQSLSVLCDKPKTRRKAYWPQSQTISAACWTWNNPRHLTFRLNTTATWSSRALFIIRRALKVGLLLVANSFVNKTRIYLKADLLDFTPDKYPIVRPIISQIVFDCSRDDCTYSPVSQRQIFLRIFTVFSWIWSNFLILESYHAILSTTFVLLSIDNPKDWPPLFGSITDAWTVQRFWGRFWHRIATPTLTTWTRTILRITHEPQTTFEKATMAFGVFFLSGIMHMTAAWRTGEGYVHLDVMFFCANFFAIAIEIAVSHAWMQVVRQAKLKPGAEARLCQASRWFGYLWTFAWFFWMAPRWLYPKTLRWLIKQALTQSHAQL